MVRKIIKIDETKCDGCGLCAHACREDAIEIINGKAKLVRDDYCDGLGNCLPACPTGAISIIEREADVFNEQAVKANKNEKDENCLQCCSSGVISGASELRQWPVQIKLVPVNAPYFNDADLLISADCCAYACKEFHQLHMEGKTTIIGCPKLDNIDYSEKLSSIIANNSIKSITVTRMEVPCCTGIEHAAFAAIKLSGKDMPLKICVLKTK